MISCAEAVRHLWEYLDGGTGPSQSAAIEEHLRLCRQCCGEAEFAAELRSFLAARTADDIPPQVRERLLAALAQMVDRP